ncbi:hypothetical protein [Pandoraea iniqua]|uniref:hypothetical protein n=1 Tax=Pandoraea iniqua TaxID=2508288 RepID=UPI00123FECC0|nr:hypothetical protein [Pandoraea iniqua]
MLTLEKLVRISARLYLRAPHGTPHDTCLDRPGRRACVDTPTPQRGGIGRAKRSRQKKMGETPISYILIAHEVRAATESPARQPAYSLILYGFWPFCNAWHGKCPWDGLLHNAAAMQ